MSALSEASSDGLLQVAVATRKAVFWRMAVTKWKRPGRKRPEEDVGVPGWETTTGRGSLIEDTPHEALNFVVIAERNAATVSGKSLRDS